MFSPNEINVLLHYYVTTDNHPNIQYPAIRAAVEMYVNQGILSRDNQVTEKGKLFIETILSTPFPCWCRTWTFPETVNLTDSANKRFKPNFCPECGRDLR